MTLKIPSSSKILCTPTRQPHAYSPLCCGGCSHSHSSQDSRFLIWAISVYFHQLSHPLFITLQTATSRAWCGAPLPGSFAWLLALCIPLPPGASATWKCPEHSDPGHGVLPSPGTQHPTCGQGQLKSSTRALTAENSATFPFPPTTFTPLRNRVT